LRLIPGNWEWRDTEETLREKIYLTMLQSQNPENSVIDQAVFNAAKTYIESQINAFVLQSESMQKQLNALESQAAHNQALLEEKDTLLRELKGNYGGNSEEIRFEERSRILKELVISLAEFERYTASQPNRSKETEAILKRFSNILGAYKVVATESIGTTVSFNPQKHRLAESADVAPGDPVNILERGFFIRDQKDKLRLLKPALVKETLTVLTKGVNDGSV
jgi:molecular chaperone GrpE (heat shock protein)